MMPRPAATAMIQARTASGACALAPRMLSAQSAPTVASQASARCRPTPMSTIRTSASPADFNSTARNGGENIWESALMAASSIGVLGSCVGVPAAQPRDLPTPSAPESRGRILE